MQQAQTDKQRTRELLRIAVGSSQASFRPGQWEAIDALVNGRRQLLVVERTGWGKSMVYFLATHLLRRRGQGPALLVSPLLALMRNQLQAAAKLGIQALTINSTNQKEWPSLEAKVRADKADILLVSPERLSNERFVEEVLRPVADRISMLIVDEAHCISDWGHDFRPDYRRIVNMLQMMPPNLPVLGTTATANNRVVTDIRSQISSMDIQRGPLMRESLVLQTMQLPSEAERLAWLAEHVPALPGTGIVYVLTKRHARRVAEWLSMQGIRAKPYYSNVKSNDFPNSGAYREYLEDLLLRNKLKVLVATVALGMGYDKPDLGFVIHFQAPGSIVAYYQQVGRAGRAIDKAYGILISGTEDERIHEYFRRSAFPKAEWVAQILDALGKNDGLTARQLEKLVNLRSPQLAQVLKYLSVERPTPVIKQKSKWYRTPVPYQLDLQNIARLTRQREEEWKETQQYIRTDKCLMQFLAEALDDPEPDRCGKCASCAGRPAIAPTCDPARAAAAEQFLRRARIALICRKQAAAGAFQEYGFGGYLPGELRAQTGRVLCQWGDTGWGNIVAADKHDDHFRDELVDAAARLIKWRWKSLPPPAWVTCVPSNNHPTLVPDLARRLAQALKLPFRPVVRKVRNNEPQKLQQNTFHQCRNLDGVFSIHGPVDPRPALLVDDIVDSSWTMTVVAALLLKNGSGPVLPFALATTSPG